METGGISPDSTRATESGHIPSQLNLWNQWHSTIEVTDAVAEQLALRDAFLRYLPAQRPLTVLDLACGQGIDSVSFALLGLDVHGLDFSPVGLARARARAAKRPGLQLQFRAHDLTDPLPFPSRSVGGIYSNLGLHYFGAKVLRDIFGELSRVTWPGGILAFAVKSVHDRHYGRGIAIEPDMYCYRGHVRHFFHRDHLGSLLAAWHVLEVEECSGLYNASTQPNAFLRVIAQRDKQ